MQVLILMLVFCFSPTLFASDFVVGEASISSSNEESPQEIKEQLQYLVHFDIVLKQLKARNLDWQEFKKRYNEKFEESFHKTAAALENSKDKDWKSKLSKKRNLELRKFGKISSVINSFNIIENNKSETAPFTYSIKMKASVDESALTKMYSHFMLQSAAKNSQQQSLLIIPEYNLKGITWSDLGVDIKNDFSTPLEEAWVKWMKEKFSSQNYNVSVLTPELSNDFGRYLVGKASKNSDWSKALIIKISFTIERTQFDELLDDSEFVISGGVALFDADSRQVLFSADIPTERENYIGQSGKGLSTKVANHLYRSPIPQFNLAAQNINEFTGLEHEDNISIVGQKNVEDILILQDYLRNKGIKYRVLPVLNNVSLNNAMITLHHSLEIDKLKDLMREIQQHGEGAPLKFTFVDNNPFALKIVSVNRSAPSQENLP